jgi:hypothetical protein
MLNNTEQPLKLELNVCLVPSATVAAKLASVSAALAAQHSQCLVELDGILGSRRLMLAPHLTLYQFPLPLKNVEEACVRLKGFASQYKTFDLEAIEYSFNPSEGSVEVRYEHDETLMAMQEHIVHILNPLRWPLLLERDPADQDVAKLCSTLTGIRGDNLRKTGFAEVGSDTFNPHATLNWFKNAVYEGIRESFDTLPEISTLGGDFNSLGLYILGPRGTCPQLLADWKLSANTESCFDCFNAPSS